MVLWKRVRNAHPLGWLAFLFVETSIPLDGLICILTNFLVETVMSIIEDGPQFPNRPKGTMEGPVSRYEVFAPVGPKQVHPRGWAGFGLKTGEGVHREGGRGEGKPSRRV